MVDLSSLKAKAQSRVQTYQDRYSSPSAPPPHARPAPSEQSSLTEDERFAQSTVLNYQRAINRPGPPPRRQLPNAAATHAASAQTAPVLPPRGGRSTEPYDTDPVPPYPASTPQEPRPALPARSSSGATPPTKAAKPSHLAASVSPSPALSTGNNLKRFSEFDERDKNDFFELLDQFFEARRSRLSDSVPSTTVDAAPVMAAPATEVSSGRSYPRPTTYGSFALDLVQSILHPAPSDDKLWFLSASAESMVAGKGIPPFLRGRKDRRWTGEWRSLGTVQTLFGCTLFSDASIAWYKIEWDARNENQIRQHLSTSESSPLVRIDTRYRPRPDTANEWTAEDLYEASVTYGPHIAQFSDDAVASGRPVARGECWDCANSAIEYASQQVGEPAFPSLDRSHGVLLYYAKVGGEQVWHANDGYVRPGDIVEWWSVKIRTKDMNKHSYMTLGDPEHTAVVVSATVPDEPFVRDERTELARLDSIEVVEQTQGIPPKQHFYDLRTMECGEIWIYRPVSLRKLVGCDFNADWNYAEQVGMRP